MKMFSTFFSAIAEKMAAVYGMTTADFLAQETSCARTTTTTSSTDEVKAALRERINKSARKSGSASSRTINRETRDGGIMREYRKATRRALRRDERAAARAQTIVREKMVEVIKLKEELDAAEDALGVFGSGDKVVAAIGTPLSVLRRALNRAIRAHEYLGGKGHKALVARVTSSMARWDEVALQRGLERERSWTYQRLDLTKVNG